MGDFTLGCLLGQYDRAQSFDVASAAISNVNSWQKFSTTTSHDFNSNPADIVVHSSGQGLLIKVFSGAANEALRYAYGAANDAHARWFPEATTHDIRVDAWGRSTAAWATGVLDIWGGAAAGFSNPASFSNVPSPHPDPMRTVLSGVTSDGDFPYVRVVALAATSDGTLLLDDVLTQIDPITLHPDYAFRGQARVVAAQHRTRGGDLFTYRWARHGAWEVPLRYLSNSHAALINWWWENQFNLAFTLDTSDAESIHVVRIVNERQPIGGKIAPYPYTGEGWQGALQLETITKGGLAF